MILSRILNILGSPFFFSQSYQRQLRKFYVREEKDTSETNLFSKTIRELLCSIKDPSVTMIRFAELYIFFLGAIR